MKRLFVSLIAFWSAHRCCCAQTLLLNAESAEEMLVSDKDSAVLPSDLPSMSPVALPSDIPSLIPSTKPTALATDAPSVILSLAPASSPTAAPTHPPSRVPTSSPTNRKRTALPSDLPSDLPSTAPSIDPTAAPTVVRVATASPTVNKTSTTSPTDEVDTPATPSDLPSDVPSSMPSDAPTTSPTIASPSSSSPTASDTKSVASSDQPSATPTKSPTLTTTEAPTISRTIATRAPAASSNTPSAAPTASKLLSTVEAITVESSITGIMDDQAIALFEEVCAEEFLPAYLPKTAGDGASLSRITCTVISQSVWHVNGNNEINNSIRRRRRLQESETAKLAVLVRVTVWGELPPNTTLDVVVKQTFEDYSTELQIRLSTSDSYFATPPPTTEGNGDGDGGPAPVVTPEQSVQQDDGVPLVVLACAAVGGALIALALVFLLVRSQRQAMESRDFEEADDDFEFEIDDDEDSKQLRNRMASESTMGPFLPPTPLGVDEIPLMIGPDSFVDCENEQLSPTSQASRNRSSAVTPRNGQRASSTSNLAVTFPSNPASRLQAFASSLWSPLGTVSPRGALSPRSEYASMSSGSSHAEDFGGTGEEGASELAAESTDSSDIVEVMISSEPMPSRDPLGLDQSVSAVHRRLESYKQQKLVQLVPDNASVNTTTDDDTRRTKGSKSSDGSSDLRGLKLLANRSVKAALDVDEIHRRPGFFSLIGSNRRRTISSSGAQETIAPPASGVEANASKMTSVLSEETSVHPKMPAVTMSGASHDMTVKASGNSKLSTRAPYASAYTSPRKAGELPPGLRFVSTSPSSRKSSEHTGKVLDDLGKFEEEWLESARASSTAETPKQANTQSTSHLQRRLSVTRMTVFGPDRYNPK